MNQATVHSKNCSQLDTWIIWKIQNCPIDYTNLNWFLLHIKLSRDIFLLKTVSQVQGKRCINTLQFPTLIFKVFLSTCKFWSSFFFNLRKKLLLRREFLVVGCSCFLGGYSISIFLPVLGIVIIKRLCGLGIGHASYWCLLFKKGCFWNGRAKRSVWNGIRQEEFTQSSQHLFTDDGTMMIVQKLYFIAAPKIIRTYTSNKAPSTAFHYPGSFLGLSPAQKTRLSTSLSRDT